MAFAEQWDAPQSCILYSRVAHLAIQQASFVELL